MKIIKAIKHFFFAQLKAQGVAATDEDTNAVAQRMVEFATKKNISEENK